MMRRPNRFSSAGIGLAAALGIFFLIWRPLAAADRPAAPGAQAPRLAVEAPVWEVQEFQPGAAFTHEFTVRNEGRAPLTIHDVRIGCSCAVVDHDRTIPPGGSGRITVTIDVHREWAGRELRRTLWIISDDRESGQFPLVVRGRVADLPAGEGSGFK